MLDTLSFVIGLFTGLLIVMIGIGWTNHAK